MVTGIYEAATGPLHTTEFWYGVFLYAAFRKEVRTLIDSAFNRVKKQLGGNNGSENTE